jgi:membrane protein
MKKAFSEWNDDQAITLSAALAYYIIFSIAPLVLIAMVVAGVVWGQAASRGQIFHAMSGLLGPEGTKTVQSFVEASSLKNHSLLATVLGVVMLLMGSTSAFSQLQDSLNMIWRVKRKPGKSVMDTLRQRLLSFSLILIIALLLLVSLVFSALISALSNLAPTSLPGGQMIWRLADISFSFALTSFLFAAIYKILPDVKLSWKDVIQGGLFTALFFSFGRFLIGFYLAQGSVTDSFGAAGSIAAILLWAYYSSAVLFFGAEFMKVHVFSPKRKFSLKPGSEWLNHKQPVL